MILIELWLWKNVISRKKSSFRRGLFPSGLEIKGSRLCWEGGVWDGRWWGRREKGLLARLGRSWSCTLRNDDNQIILTFIILVNSNPKRNPKDPRNFLRNLPRISSSWISSPSRSYPRRWWVASTSPHRNNFDFPVFKFT